MADGVKATNLTACTEIGNTDFLIGIGNNNSQFMKYEIPNIGPLTANVESLVGLIANLEARIANLEAE